MGETIYGYSPDEHEYSADVPQLTVGDPPLRIYISAHGGGTVGESYAHNGWDYLVTEDGRTVLEGSDIRSGLGATHGDMARSLAVFLSAAGESFHYHEHVSRDGWQQSEHASGYTPGEAAWLEANYERLSMMDY